MHWASRFRQSSRGSAADTSRAARSGAVDVGSGAAQNRACGNANWPRVAAASAPSKRGLGHSRKSSPNRGRKSQGPCGIGSPQRRPRQDGCETWLRCSARSSRGCTSGGNVQRHPATEGDEELRASASMEAGVLVLPTAGRHRRSRTYEAGRDVSRSSPSTTSSDTPTPATWSWSGRVTTSPYG